MKSLIQRLLQQILGYDRYLWYFTLYKLKTLRWDKNENDFFFFLTLINPGALVLDIGANLGLMSYYLAQNNSVIAFEPMPNNIKIINSVKRKFKLTKLQLLTCALGNETKKIQLVLPVVNGVKKQGLSHVVDAKMTEFTDGQFFEADCHRLDDIVQVKNQKITAIKIDVENFEFEVFQGAENLLKRDKPIIYCELWDNDNRKQCFDFLQEIGYRTNILRKGKLVQIESNPSNIQNFFFIHKQS